MTTNPGASQNAATSSSSSRGAAYPTTSGGKGAPSTLDEAVPPSFSSAIVSPATMDGEASPTVSTKGEAVGGQRVRKTRRRAVFVSEVDQRLVALGLEPSWEQKVSESGLEASGSIASSQNAGTNDRRLAENVPPHSHARAF